MKIKYCKPDNLFKFLEDSYFVMTNKKRLLKKEKPIFFNSFKRYLIVYVAFIILSFFWLLECLNTNHIFCKIMFGINFCYLLLLIFNHGLFFYTYFKTKKKELSGTITLDEDGIADEDKESKCVFKWNFISSVIVSNYSINIFLNNKNIYLRLPISIKKDVLKNIKKYSDIQILDLTSIN